jgi:hypothetical protein
MGADQRLEYCVSRIVERKPGSLHVEAVLRVTAAAFDGEEGLAQVTKPGARVPVALFDVRLDRGAQVTRFSFAPIENRLAPTIVTLRRRAE